jgi:predicted ATP-dependent Lon-type protease
VVEAAFHDQRLTFTPLAPSSPSSYSRSFLEGVLATGCVADIPSVSGELFSEFQVSFHPDPVDAVFRGLGVG